MSSSKTATPRSARTSTKNRKQAATVKAQSSKSEQLIAALQRPEGATIAHMSELTGWLPHSIRGFMAGALRKRHGLSVTSEKTDAGRVYRIAGTGA